MNQHFADVKNYVCKDKHTDSYAKHFQQFFDKSNNIPTPAKLRKMAEFNILWKGNITSMMKTFGTNQCRLFMRERLEILHRPYKDKQALLIRTMKSTGRVGIILVSIDTRKMNY